MRILIITIKPGLRGGIEKGTRPIYKIFTNNKHEITFFFHGEKVNFEPSWKKVFLRFFDLIKLSIIIFKTNPEIVHIDSSFNKKGVLRDFFTSLLLRWMGIPFFILFHGSNAPLIAKNKFYNFFGRVILSSARQVGVLSTAEQKQFKHYFPASNTIVVKYGVAQDSYQPKPNRSEDKSLLFIGRFIREKGPLEVIKAYKIMLNNFPRLELIMVGDGPALNESKELANTLGIYDQIDFVGNIKERQTVPYYANCDIVVLPTYFAEGLPVVIIRALSYGKAIVTTRVRGAADYLSEPQNCLWVKPRNPKDLAEKISKLLTDQPLVDKMATNNTELFKSFSPAQAAKSFVKIYREIINNNTESRKRLDH